MRLKRMSAAVWGSPGERPPPLPGSKSPVVPRYHASGARRALAVLQQTSASPAARSQGLRSAPALQLAL
jgi:hypothetical protein